MLNRLFFIFFILITISCFSEKSTKDRSYSFIVIDTEIREKYQLDTTILTANEKAILKQDSINGVYIPFDLVDCFQQIDQLWADSIKNKIKDGAVDEFLANAHFGFGMWMRNNWGLWSPSRLQIYFNSFEVYHPDDMSSIILNSYYRRLKKEDIDFDGQLKQIQEYWQPIKDCEHEKLKRGAEITNKYNIGDSITILMPVDDKNAVLYGCPTLDWEYNEDTDLRLLGLIVNKHINEDDKNSVFEIKILNMTPSDIEILMQEVSIDSIIKMYSGDLTIEE